MRLSVMYLIVWEVGCMVESVCVGWCMLHGRKGILCLAMQLFGMLVD